MLARYRRAGARRIEILLEIGDGEIAQLLRRDLAGELETVNGVGQTVGAEDGWPTHDVEVQMRGRRVARVADLAQHLSALDLVAWLDRYGSLLHVRVEREVAADVEDDVVAEGILQGDRARVRRVGRLRVLHIVERLHDGAVGDGQDGVAVPAVTVHVSRVAVQVVAVVVEADPIYRVSLGDVEFVVDWFHRPPVRALRRVAGVPGHPALPGQRRPDDRTSVVISKGAAV